jgi:prophage regulatory protein
MQRLLAFNELKERGVPYSEEHLRRLALRGEFPKPVKLGGNSIGARKAWVESEIAAWIESRIAARDIGPEAA